MFITSVTKSNLFYDTSIRSSGIILNFKIEVLQFCSLNLFLNFLLSIEKRRDSGASGGDHKRTSSVLLMDTPSSGSNRSGVSGGILSSGPDMRVSIGSGSGAVQSSGGTNVGSTAAPPSQSPVSYSLTHHIGAGGTAIAAAASQAIAATQQVIVLFKLFEGKHVCFELSSNFYLR